MAHLVNGILQENGEEVKCHHFIISGGIRNALTGLRLIESCDAPAVFAMGQPFLEAALQGLESLRDFVKTTLEELAMARAFLDWEGKGEEKSWR